MAVRRKKNWISGAISALVGLFCALVLCAVFYGTMVYQQAEEEGTEEATSTPLLSGLVQPSASGNIGPIQAGVSAETQFPGPLLALEEDGATLVQEWVQDVEVSGRNCRVVTRIYARWDGSAVSAISATPANYLEKLSEPGYEPQLITGFILDDLDALHLLRGETSVLTARDGEYVYMLEARADEQTLYALGASARRNKVE